MAIEQVALLSDEGADLSRVVLGHLDLQPDIVYLEQVLSSGVNVAFDTFGKEWFDYRVPNSEGEGGGRVRQVGLSPAGRRTGSGPWSNW